MIAEEEAAARARAWRYAAHADVCDVIEPWEYGTIVRATRMPTYWDFNVVRVEQEPAMDLGALVGVADAALAGLDHRKLDFDVPERAKALRPDFEAKGWKASAVVWMRWEGPLPDGPDIGIQEVPYDSVVRLREAWHREDFPGVDPGDFPTHAREVAQRRGVVVLAAIEKDVPVGYAEIERRGDGADITSVFVHPEHRGAGLGTALTRAAIESGRDAADLWISADAEGRPRGLYARLGFRPVWEQLEFLLINS